MARKTDLLDEMSGQFLALIFADGHGLLVLRTFLKTDEKASYLGGNNEKTSGKDSEV